MLRRLKIRPEFLRVAATRRKWVAPGLILQVCPGQDERKNVRDADPGVETPDGIRVGFTVSRKVGDAVVRNRARRRLRAAAEQVLPVHAKGGRDYVLIGRGGQGGTIRRPFEALVGDLETALRRIDCFREADADMTETGAPKTEDGAEQGTRRAK